jgi:putative ABC transport system permease protein
MINPRFALRILFRTPLLTGVAIVSLALGIGANAAMFSLFNQVLLRPLPVQEPEQLVNLSAPGPKPGSQSCSNAGNCDVVFSYPMFRDLERVQQPFTGIAAHREFGANIGYSGQTSSGEGLLVSGSYFPVLGLQPALGRLLGADDDRAVGDAPVVVLSYLFWQNRFASDPNVLNQALVVNGQSLTIVGVAPRGFDGTTFGSRPDIFVPITLRGTMSPGFKGFDNRQSYWAYLFARLKPGVSLDQAATAINTPYAQIINDVEAPLQKGMSDATMARFRAKTVGVEPGGKGQSTASTEARAPLTMLLAVTGFVLLIACANIANLLLARGARRASEMAVRLSIGANRRQLIAQLLTESMILAVLGGLAGLLVARWTLGVVATILPPEAANIIALKLETPVLLFALGLTLLTGILFGLFPALQSTRPDLLPTLKGQAGQPGGGRAARRFRTVLATAQIALSMALLVAAGLFTKSLMNISRVDLGLKIDNLVTFRISPELNGYTDERSQIFFQRLEEELAQVPGVTAVTASLVPALSGSNWGSDVRVEGFQNGPDVDNNSRFNEVGPGYFRAMGIPLMSGREFTDADTLRGPKVVIVNEAFLKKFNLGRDAVGKRMGSGRGNELDTEIVGVVQNAKYSDVKQEIPPLFFRPYRQDDAIGSMSYYLRTSLDPERLLTTIPKVVAGLDANLPIENAKTMPQQVRENVFLDRFIGLLSSGFAILATLLAAVGLYGVLAYTVAQRTREIGLRMALGAAPARIRGMILRQVAIMTAIGGAIGLAAAIGIGKLGESMLYQLNGWDPAVLATAAVLLTIVALGAGLVPALKASRVDPMNALRYE